MFIEDYTQTSRQTYFYRRLHSDIEANIRLQKITLRDRGKHAFTEDYTQTSRQAYVYRRLHSHIEANIRLQKITLRARCKHTFTEDYTQSKMRCNKRLKLRGSCSSMSSIVSLPTLRRFLFFQEFSSPRPYDFRRFCS